jgi:hypothetical protein
MFMLGASISYTMDYFLHNTQHCPEEMRSCHYGATLKPLAT